MDKKMATVLPMAIFTLLVVTIFKVASTSGQDQNTTSKAQCEKKKAQDFLKCV
jgi:hypothetical protein